MSITDINSADQKSYYLGESPTVSDDDEEVSKIYANYTTAREVSQELSSIKGQPANQLDNSAQPKVEKVAASILTGSTQKPGWPFLLDAVDSNKIRSQKRQVSEKDRIQNEDLVGVEGEIPEEVAKGVPTTPKNGTRNWTHWTIDFFGL
jgi:hypothetical protein